MENHTLLHDSDLLFPMGYIRTYPVARFASDTVFEAGLIDPYVVEGVRFNRLSLQFEDQFIPKLEQDVPPRTLRVHMLTEKADSRTIINALGGNEVVEIHLATMWQVLQVQGTGQEPGNLYITGGAGPADGTNLTFIRDRFGDLVSVRWYWQDGWCTEVRSFYDADAWWAPGSRVISG